MKIHVEKPSYFAAEETVTEEAWGQLRGARVAVVTTGQRPDADKLRCLMKFEERHFFLAALQLFVIKPSLLFLLSDSQFALFKILSIFDGEGEPQVLGRSN